MQAFFKASLLLPNRRKILSLFRGQNIFNKYIGLLNHILSNKNFVNEKLIFFKNSFVFYEVQKDERELILVTAKLFLHGEKDGHTANLFVILEIKYP